MKCECYPHDPEKFATNLRLNNTTKTLVWDSAQAQSSLIVQTPFGENAADMIDKICAALEQLSFLTNDFTEIFNGVWACLVSASDKARNNGCRLNGEASTYTVFSCNYANDTISLYRPQEQAMITSSVDIPLEIKINVSQEIAYQGLFRKHPVNTGYYIVTFPDELGNSYTAGSLGYSVDDFEIPITKEMIAQGTVYIKSTEAPKIIPKSRGLKIIIE